MIRNDVPLFTMETVVGLPITKRTFAKCYNNALQIDDRRTSGSKPVTDVSQATMMPLHGGHV